MCNTWSAYNVPATASFNNLIAYSNDKGAEYVQSSVIQFKNFVIWDHYSIGIDTKTYKTLSTNTVYRSFQYNDVGPLIADSVIIGNSNEGASSNYGSGLSLIWDHGQLITNVSFYNFPNKTTSAMKVNEINDVCRLFQVSIY